MTFTIGTDIGGTFTDCVVVDEAGAITTGKSPTTVDNRAVGFFAAIENAAEKLGLSLEGLLAETERLVHATTAGSNALVERTGAKVGLLTTAGHGEAMLIMRGGGRTKGLDVDQMLHIAGTYKPEPIVPPHLIREIPERVDSFGEEVVALDEEAVVEAVRDFAAEGVEGVAVSLLWSFRNPDHERRIRAIVREQLPGAFVSCSHEVAPRLGEYYRTVATVMNCYIGPLMNTYIEDVVSGAEQRSFRRPVLFAQCIGGAMPVETVRQRPLRTLDSGPVSGVVASNFLGDSFEQPNIITTDMGGTTFDISVITANVPRQRASTIVNQYEMYLPRLDVESIGAGGGSIAWLDPASGTMKVGPHSAGADPGPMCYPGGGDKPTVTDANVALGVINPERFLGGRRHLDREASLRGIETLSGQLGITVDETAAGIVRIIDTTMAEKIRRMTVFRGEDPREYVLYAFGGAGPMHAGGFARELGVQAVVIPLGNLASVLSAMGTIAGDVSHVFDRSVRLATPVDVEQLRDGYAELEREAVAQLRSERVDPEDIALVRSASMKYGAQVHDVEVPFPADAGIEEMTESFERIYASRFGEGSGYASAGIVITNLRVHATGSLPRPRIGERGEEEADDAAAGSRSIYWEELGERVETPTISALPALGESVVGPAVIELPDTTVPVRPGQLARSDRWGNLILDLEGDR